MTREVAIKSIQDFTGWFKKDKPIYEALEMAKQALSQEPQCTEHPCLGTLCRYYKEPCDDVVSREAVLSKIQRYNETEGGFSLINSIKQLPSVTQKSESVTEFADRCRECGAKYGKYRKEAKRWKNKWLKSQKSGKWDRSCTCSVCGQWRILESEKNGGKYKYCPNCGSAMKGE